MTTTEAWRLHFQGSAAPNLTLRPRHLSVILDEAADAAPRATALRFQNMILTYAELRERAERFAASLRRCGVHPGDRVAVMLPNLPQTVVAFWGVMKAGATAVMTNPLYREAELKRHFKDAGVRVLITLDLLWQHIEPLLPTLELDLIVVADVRDALRPPLNWLYALKRWRNGGAPAIPWNERVVPWRDFCLGRERYSPPAGNPHAEIALLQYTGGTTGEPKGAMLTHAGLTAQLTQLLSILHLKEDERHTFLSIMPFFHVFGLMGNIVLPAAMKAATIPVPRYTPGDLLRTIKKFRPTFFVGAPSVYISLMQQKNISQYDLTCIRYCISGSAPFPAETLHRWQEMTRAAITEGYGLTEASPVLCANPIQGEQKIGSVGVPLPLTDIRIVDTEDPARELGDNEWGELIARGPQLMAGYWNRPDETAVTLRDGWLHTGDIAYRDKDGYYFLVDRKKDLVIVGGYNVYPREVEEVLYEHPQVAEAVAVGVKHPTRGEALKAFIVPKAGAILSKSDLAAHCRARLANYKIPKFFEFRTDLPKTIIGKVLRRALRDEEKKTPPAATKDEEKSA